MRGATHRLKISTTVAPETHGYLERLVESGRATSIAEAIDQTVLQARRADSIERLEQDTVAYFQALSRADAVEELRLESAVAEMADVINIDD